MKADVAETDRNTVAGTGAGRVTRRESIGCLSAGERVALLEKGTRKR